MAFGKAWGAAGAILVAQSMAGVEWEPVVGTLCVGGTGVWHSVGRGTLIVACLDGTALARFDATGA